MIDTVPQSVWICGGRVKVVGMFLEMKDKSKIKTALAEVAIHSQIASVHEQSLAMTPPFRKILNKYE